MKICNLGHEFVVYESSQCPACRLLQLYGMALNKLNLAACEIDKLKSDLEIKNIEVKNENISTNGR